jgi:hypothetical protein
LSGPLGVPAGYWNAVVVAALAATGSGSPAAAKTVNGTVGPGFTIGTTMQGKKVTKLKAGTAYRRCHQTARTFTTST